MAHHAEPLDILYEDDDLLAVNKPPGLSVHPSAREPSGTLADAIVAYDPSVANVGDPRKPGDPLRPGIVHRLDKDTSGVLIVARNQGTFEELKRLFQTRAVEKRYLAIVDGRVKEQRGTIVLPIGRIGLKRGTREGKRTLRKSKDAETAYIVRRRFQDATLLELLPKTGRTHQIRVHMKAIGHPVLGDHLYGGKRISARAPRQMLHAFQIAFSRSDGRRFAFEIDPPGDFQNVLESLSVQSQDNEEQQVTYG